MVLLSNSTGKLMEQCANCKKELGFFKCDPKKDWNMEGQLCRKCWNTIRSEKNPTKQTNTEKKILKIALWVLIISVITLIVSLLLR